MDIKGNLAKMPFYLVCFVCITRFLKPQILYKYTISAKGKQQNCIFIHLYIRKRRLFMYHSDRKTCVVAHIKHENVVRMSFLSPIRSNHGACLFLYDGVRTCFVEGVVFQIDLVECALKPFQRHFALFGLQLTLPQDDGVPTEQTELDALLHVAFAVALNLGFPEGGVCFG